MARHALAAAAVLAMMGCDGIGSRPLDENEGAVMGPATSVSLQGCLVTGRGGGYRLRSMSPDMEDGGAAPATTRDGASTSINGPRVGTRDYEIVAPPAGQDLATLTGQRVRAEGTMRVPAGVQAEGTDQVQARNGARFPQLELATITPLNESCVDPAATDRARARDSDSPSHERPAGAAPASNAH